MTGADASSDERVLLVEGQGDMHVVRHIRLSVSPMPAFSTVDKVGVDSLLASIRNEILAPDRVAVGILVDANDDLQSRWQAVCG